jgi:hypothetical protein
LTEKEDEEESNVVDTEEIIEQIEDEVVEDDSLSLREELQNEIDGLKEFLDLMDEEDKKETQELIDELEQQIEFI